MSRIDDLVKELQAADEEARKVADRQYKLRLKLRMARRHAKPDNVDEEEVPAISSKIACFVDLIIKQQEDTHAMATLLRDIDESVRAAAKLVTATPDRLDVYYKDMQEFDTQYRDKFDMETFCHVNRLVNWSELELVEKAASVQMARALSEKVSREIKFYLERIVKREEELKNHPFRSDLDTMTKRK